MHEFVGGLAGSGDVVAGVDHALEQEFETRLVESSTLAVRVAYSVLRSREDAESVPMVETVGTAESGYDRVEAQFAAEGAPLTERESTVLRLRFEEDLNQYEIGQRLGVSQMQISRIMRKALRKLLDAVQAEGPPGEGGSASR